MHKLDHSSVHFGRNQDNHFFTMKIRITMLWSITRRHSFLMFNFSFKWISTKYHLNTFCVRCISPNDDELRQMFRHLMMCTENMMKHSEGVLSLQINIFCWNHSTLSLIIKKNHFQAHQKLNRFFKSINNLVRMWNWLSVNGKEVKRKIVITKCGEKKCWKKDEYILLWILILIILYSFDSIGMHFSGVRSKCDGINTDDQNADSIHTNTHTVSFLSTLLISPYNSLTISFTLQEHTSLH